MRVGQHPAQELADATAVPTFGAAIGAQACDRGCGPQASRSHLLCVGYAPTLYRYCRAAQCDQNKTPDSAPHAEITQDWLLAPADDSQSRKEYLAASTSYMNFRNNANLKNRAKT